jgi:hypothetical protein
MVSFGHGSPGVRPNRLARSATFALLPLLALGSLAVVPTTAGAQTANTGVSLGPTVAALQAEVAALEAQTTATVQPVLDAALSVACLAVAIASGNVLPPYPPPGPSCGL